METTAIQNLFIDLTRSQLKLYPLAAIWLEKPLQMPDKKSARITSGDVVRIEDGKLSDCSNWEKATHFIVGGKGRLDSSELYLELQSFETLETITLKIQ